MRSKVVAGEARCMTSTADRFAPFRLSLDDLPERNWTETLRDLYGRIMVKHELEPLTDVAPQLDATLWTLPGLGLSSVTCSSFHLWRTNDQIDSDDLVLNVTLAGERRHRQRGREAEIAEGEAVLATCADTADTIVSPGTRFISFRMPRDVLAPMIADPDAGLCQPIPRDTGALRLLVSYAKSLQDAHALATPELRHLVTTHVYDLAALVIGATRDAGAVAGGRGVRAARLRAIKADILENLTDRRLSIEFAATRHGVTPRYVSMLFEGNGTTFSEFVLVQRLNRAHRLLIDRRFSERTVSFVAFEAGFGDISYFNRAFRRRYGATPSDVRAEAQDKEQS
jgi:AraC-like DNA-binding protein